MYTLARTTRAASYAEMRRKGAIVATVTYFLPGGLLPREITTEFWGRVSDETLAYYAPEGAYAFERSDRRGIYYINGSIYTFFELIDKGQEVLARNIGSSLAGGAVLDQNGKWHPFFRADKVVMTSR